jgi:hypothetical protein
LAFTPSHFQDFTTLLLLLILVIVLILVFIVIVPAFAFKVLLLDTEAGLFHLLLLVGDGLQVPRCPLFARCHGLL